MAARIEYRQVVDDRFDPFNESDQSVAVSTERHVIPTSSPFQIQLLEVPRQDSPSTVTIAGFTEVSGTPATGEFRVDYKYRTGLVQFNSADGGTAIAVNYQGTGSPVASYVVNELLDQSGFAAGSWSGHDWADHFTTAASPMALNLLTQGDGYQRGGGTPRWVAQSAASGNYSVEPTISASSHQLSFRTDQNDSVRGGVYVDQTVIVDKVPVMFEWRARTDLITLTVNFAWGLCSRSTAVGNAFPGDNPTPRAVVRVITPSTPTLALHVNFVTCDSIGSTTTSTIAVVDVRSFNTYRIEARPSGYKLYIANTFGVFIERANHTTNLPNSHPLVFGFFADEDGNSVGHPLYSFDSARRITLGNSPA